MSRIVALCGGIGGAKLAFGLAKVLPPNELTIIVNTGDDFEHLGLTICPDIDAVLYTLSGRESHAHGWGREDETWHVMDELGALRAETWFKLGDKDIALHLTRLHLLRHGLSLTQVTRELAARLGVLHAVLPMANEPVRTIVGTFDGDLPFQEYFVRRQCEPKVTGFRFHGAESATLSAEIEAALRAPDLRGVVVCPSNPYVSIGPILSIAPLRDLLSSCIAPVLAVSPIIGGRAIKGPTGKMMAELGSAVSSQRVAEYYGDLIDALVLDEADRGLEQHAQRARSRLVFTRTLMQGAADRIALAKDCLRIIDALSQG
jgi:LPPG:FO 2-phospho-L-lactate transferase